MPLALGLLAAVLAGCKAEVIDCGPCRTLQEGVVSVAGDPRIDGYLLAAHQAEREVARAVARFDAAMLGLAEVHGLPAGDVTDQYVDDLMRLVITDIADHVEGPLGLVGGRSTCAIDQAAVLDAQRACERAAGCEPEGPPTPTPVTCRGRCTGICQGTCEGALACGTAMPTAPCEGACEGVCAPSEPGPCPGRCRGTCDGDCDRTDPTGLCVGRCEGTCEGTCQPDEPEPCAGTCHGRCWIDPADPACAGATACAGACDGLCIGACEGELIPPGTADCDARESCQRQARARGLAALECRAASVRVHYDLDPGLDTEAAAAFAARVEVLVEAARVAREAGAYLGLIIEGERDGVPLLDPPPIDRLQALTADALPHAEQAHVALASGRRECLEPALEEAAERIDDQPGRSARARAALERFAERLP